MEAGDWRFEAIEVIRGDEAWQRIQSANQFNNPPTAGNEYVAVLVRARYEGEGEEDIDQFDFRITGSRGRADRVAFVIDLDPWLDYTLQAGGEVEGWVTFEVGEAESQLMLIFDRFRVFDDVPVFLALRRMRTLPSIEAHCRRRLRMVGRARSRQPSGRRSSRTPGRLLFWSTSVATMPSPRWLPPTNSTIRRPRVSSTSAY